MARRFKDPSVVAEKENWSSWIEIDLNAFEHNLQQIRLHSSAPILPVLKGDAYGHGAPVLAAFLKTKNCPLLAVSTVEEAVSILDITKVSIFLLTPPLANQLELVLKHKMIPAVTSMELVRKLNTLAQKKKEHVTIHLKVDTGFGRLGIPPEEALLLAEEIKKTPYIKLGGVFSHFSFAYQDSKFTNKQLNQLLELRRKLIEKGWQQLTWHIANSAALLTLPSSHLDLVRVGTLLYGQSPLSLNNSWDLQSTWLFKTRLIQIRTIPKGQTIGYGRSYRTTKPTKVGVIPVGYSHGLELEPQSAPWRQVKQALSKILKTNLDLVSHASVPLPILGRIGMNLTCVNLESVPWIQVGDELTVAMRRVTSSGHVPRIYFYNKQVQCIFWNGKIFHNGQWKTSLKDLFSTRFPLDGEFLP